MHRTRACSQLLLDRCRDGEAEAKEELFGLLRDELRSLATRAMKTQREGHTLQPTALVHEAWMRLLGGSRSDFSGREHFLATAARAMRSVLIDHARRRQADKRHAGDRVLLDEELLRLEHSSYGLVELDDALQLLAERSPRRARLVELRFFAGLTIAQAAGALGISTATVEREWRIARMFLREHLRPSG